MTQRAAGARPQKVTTRLVFTLDVEDHLGSYASDARFAGNTVKVLDLLDSLQVQGTFFIVGRIAETHPGLVREAANRGHEIACHSYDHFPIEMETPASFASKLTKAKDLLEQVGGRKVAGFRAPVFSLTPSTAWAVDVIGETGFAYSSSILPAPNPLYSFVGAPRVPFRWPNGLLEFPVPVASFLGAWLPFLGGVYFRYLPWRMISTAMRRMPQEILQWTYFHPYDFDVSEPFARMPRTSLATNLICWLHRGTTNPRVARLFKGQPSGRFCDIIEAGSIRFLDWAPA
jgi:polysaccharide deacetylase family protein (PEP-CTERM system associated)